jgi:hypothetical protein
MREYMIWIDQRVAISVLGGDVLRGALPDPVVWLFDAYHTTRYHILIFDIPSRIQSKSKMMTEKTRSKKWSDRLPVGFPADILQVVPPS